MNLLFALCLMLLAMPLVVDAKSSSTSGTIYGTITVEESDWTPSGDTYSVTQVYYITKSSEYVYFNIEPVLNIEDVNILESSSAYTVVSKTDLENGSVNVLLKASNGSGVSGTKTELFTVVAKIKDPDKLECNLSYSPLSLNCLKTDGLYFDKNGKTVSEAEWNTVCGNYTPTPEDTPSDEPNPETGSVVPYIAIGGGLLAIAAVYLVSRKSNKMYKI